MWTLPVVLHTDIMVIHYLSSLGNIPEPHPAPFPIPLEVNIQTETMSHRCVNREKNVVE